MGASIIGQDHLVESLLIGLVGSGHVLLTGAPGLGKTRAARCLARNLDLDYRRIQFTPDLLPSDVIGTEILQQRAGGDDDDGLHFVPGPVFGNLILADQLNRAPARAQSALLEAMDERQVTVAGVARRLPDPFLVVATQVPGEQEGTYPLPEAQLDRFLLHVSVDHPDQESEIDIVRLARTEDEAQDAAAPGAKPLGVEAVLQARSEVRQVFVSDTVECYVVDLVAATRHPARYGEELAGLIESGAGPRGAIGLDRCARAHAWLAGRDHVTPDDVRAVVHDVLRHRITPSYHAITEGISAHDAIDRLVQQVAVV